MLLERFFRLVEIIIRDTLVYKSMNAEMKLILSSDVHVLPVSFQINSAYECFPHVNQGHTPERIGQRSVRITGHNQSANTSELSSKPGSCLHHRLS